MSRAGNDGSVTVSRRPGGGRWCTPNEIKKLLNRERDSGGKLEQNFIYLTPAC